MLRAGCQLLTQSALPAGKTGGNSFALEFVRWRRKPRWLPVAKSKLFRVPERKKQTEEERTELMRLHNHYKTQLRSVRQFLREEVVRHEETSTADHIVLTPEQEEAEFQKCLDVNAAWNAAIAKERDQRLAKEREEKVAYVQERLEARQVREEERREKANQRVLLEIERSKTYITKENLDAAIEAALANPVDHNFAIDLAGNLYKGRSTSQLPDANPEPNQQVLSN
ncbi:probable 28S ribosomal protein S26, mitochondrial [Drosophila ficusphila]|uniref:probable 28S ribosomal protein S26, mitochondrial n=1 Tax=Drosophila ficusphila TaxID=30025 RepID=UPI0007E64FCE|nr:probable 28S ribosomal protein S26, mitochondrial [Drosophila ficusphila]